MFAAFGIWFGLRLTRRCETVVVKEVLIPVNAPAFKPLAPHTNQQVSVGITACELEVLTLVARSFGFILSVLMSGSLLLAKRIDINHSVALGYIIMVASFLLVYFGIRSYRDNHLAGQISFGRAFACGILIMLITSVCYVAMWEVLYFDFMPHFLDSYFAEQIHKVQSSGLDPATTAARVAAIQHSQELYQNSFVNLVYTFMEPLPAGIVMTFLSAAVLRRQDPVEPAVARVVMIT